MKFTHSWLKYFLETDATARQVAGSGAFSLPLTGRVPGAARRPVGGVTLAEVIWGGVF